MTVGRGEDNSVTLSDTRVSRVHARIEQAEVGLRIVDLGSRHGTYVNGERVTTSTLADGDQIQLGDVLLVLQSADDGYAVVAHTTATLTVGANPFVGERRSARRLRLLYSLTRALAAADVDINVTLGRIVEDVRATLECEQALLALRERGPRESVKIARTRSGSDDRSAISVSPRLLTIVDRGEGAVVRVESPVGAEGEIVEAMGVPLISGGISAGYLYVGDRSRDAFSEEDLEFLTALAQMIMGIVDSAERYERVAIAAQALRGGETPLVGESPPMRRLFAEIERFGTLSTHVLVRGETGTGKEHVARLLHAVSPRAAEPFITVNCAALPETMIESELFGHEPGAFTSAVRRHRGRFALAHRGTLFLDEIGDLGLAAQAKLLRAIEYGEIQPLGSEKIVKVDVRVISATHRDLERACEAGKFREDLFYRLSVAEIEVPPLRDRPGDIALLGSWFLDQIAPRIGKRQLRLDPEALRVLEAYPWRGNVRELRNEIERAAITCRGALIRRADFGRRLADAAMAPRQRTLAEQFADLVPTERALVEEALSRAHGRVAEAARLLGITWIMMKKRMERHGISASTSVAGGTS